MKNLISTIALVCVCSTAILAQAPTNFIGISRGIESNIGFHGYQFSFDKEFLLKNRWSMLASINHFTANKIPDRHYDFANQYYRSTMLDIEAQLRVKEKENRNGLKFHIGPGVAVGRAQYVQSFITTAMGTTDVKIVEDKMNPRISLKYGGSYQFSLKNTPIVLDLSVRSFYSSLPEPTISTLGFKVGF
jgi:hypothetical protein